MNAWAYQIDYDKEIALDRAEIERLSRPLFVALSERMEQARLAAAVFGDWYDSYPEIYRGLIDVPELLPMAGISADDMRAVMVYFEVEDHPFGDEQKGDYSRGLALMGGFGNKPGPLAWLRDERMMTETKRVEALKKAKSALSRHTRNKAKFGK